MGLIMQPKRPCKRCGAMFLPPASLGRPAVHCGPACREAHSSACRRQRSEALNKPRPCKHCGAMFRWPASVGRSAVYCGATCRRLASRQRVRERYSSDPEFREKCVRKVAARYSGNPEVQEKRLRKSAEHYETAYFRVRIGKSVRDALRSEAQRRKLSMSGLIREMLQRDGAIE